jgi:DNA ligase-1
VDTDGEGHGLVAWAFDDGDGSAHTIGGIVSSFSQLAQLGESLAATKKKLEHRALIGAYLKSLPPDEIPIAARLIIGRPFAEGDPRILNLSGSAVSQAVEVLTGAPVAWSDVEGVVDFGEAVQKWLELRGHTAQGQPLGLLEVHQAYDAIAQDTGPGSRERKGERVVGLLRRASPVEAKYLVKHLVKEMRVGVNELSLLDAIADASGLPSREVRRTNQVIGDVGEVARAALIDGAAGLARASLRIGRPLKPMLAQPADDVADAFARLAPPIALEYKLDGVRVQIHKLGDRVHLFSRNLSDITESLPEVVEAVRKGAGAERAIFDGEVIALTPDGRPRPFQDVMRRVGRERDLAQVQSEIAVKLFLFDALAVDDMVCLDMPNAERWEVLQHARGDLDCVARIVPADVTEGEAFLRQAREAGHEGLVAKSLASPYAPGERGRYWMKIKPIVTLDLAIIAAEWGYGRRTGWLSNVHLAARDAETGELLDVGKTFKGLTDTEFRSLTETLLSNRVAEQGNTVVVKPTIVVEVAFNNVQRSPRYRSGVALRLARIVNFRPDKSIDQIETVQFLRHLMEAERR